MNRAYDVIVLGLGGMGSAVADRLSRSGHRVLGLEQFSPVHDKGSSHGETRAIRKAYFEDPKYVPLVLRSYELWDELQNDAKQKLIEKCGCMIMGPGNSPVVRGCEKSATQFSLPYEMFDSNALTKKYSFHVPKNTVGFFEPDGGYLFVEKCVEQFLHRARTNGADLRFNCKSTSWKSSGGDIEVASDGELHLAKKLVICQGAWAGKNLKEQIPLAPKRTIQFWFRSSTGANLPVFFQDTSDGRWIYGFPKIGETIKFAFHNATEDCDPDKMNREVSEGEIEHVASYARSLIPSLGEYSHAKTCIYTMTPDEHFVLGRLKTENVFLAAGFSGHGFKFAPVIGEIADDFVSDQSLHDIQLFNPFRFS